MVGIQGSGKTTLTETAFPNHIHISLDKIEKFPSAKKCELSKRYTIDGLSDQPISEGRKIEYVLINNALRNGKNIVIDDTNITRQIRRRHIILAQKYHCTVNAIFFLNIQKAYEQNKNRKKPLDKEILDRFHKDLELSHKSEGFEFIQVMY